MSACHCNFGEDCCCQESCSHQSRCRCMGRVIVLAAVAVTVVYVAAILARKCRR